MGCDIFVITESKVDGVWNYRYVPTTKNHHPDDDEKIFYRSYGLFGFLAGVRNYSAVTPIAEIRGLPADASYTARESYTNNDYHSCSWLSLSELLAFDYDQTMVDRRVTKQIRVNAWDGSVTGTIEEGQITTYREFLGPNYFNELARLQNAGVERIVFYFSG